MAKALQQQPAKLATMHLFTSLVTANIFRIEMVCCENATLGVEYKMDKNLRASTTHGIHNRHKKHIMAVATCPQLIGGTTSVDANPANT
ncbi:Protein of unknown function [Gryllus bimaculatus]|nr:Protein of unknown function [Gryllus bimaculatus]